ncbi:MAG: hypothetical protein HKN47_22740 [Pirellulaceae bacterium]|nr:hypothetical protein [Pirellulaceae bacterium]
MITTNCPRCTESIRIPTDQIPSGAYAQCPLCRETFPVEEIVQQLPPVVNLMDGDGQPLILSQSPARAAANVPGDPGLADDNPFFTAPSVGDAALGIADVSDDENDLSDIADLDELDDPAVILDGGPLADSDEQYDAEDLNAFEEGFSDDDIADAENEADGDYDDDKTVILDTWVDQEGASKGAVASSVDSDDAYDEDAYDADADEHADGDSQGPLLVEEDPMEDYSDVGISNDVQPLKVRKRKSASAKKSSPLRTLGGIALGPLIALPLAGGILLVAGKAPNLGFYPFDGTYSSAGKPSVVASDVGPSPRNPPRAFGSSLQNNARQGSSSLVAPGSDIADLVEDMQPDDADTGLPALPAADNLEPVTIGELDAPDTLMAPEPLDAPSPETTDANSGFSLPGAGASPATDPIDPFSDAPATPSVDETTSSDGSADTGVAGDDPFGPGAADDDVPTGQPTMPEDDLAAPELADPAVVDRSTPEPEPATPEPEPATPEPELSMPEIAAPEIPPATAPAAADSSELTTAIGDADQAVQGLIAKQAAGEGTKRDIAQTYVQLSKVGTFADADQSAAVTDLLTSVKESSLLNLFGASTVTQWMKYSKRPTDGVLMTGTYSADAETITLSDGTAIKVAPAEGGSQPADQSEVIAVGEIVGDNTVRLSGSVPLK